MKHKRRDFLKLTSLAGSGFVGASLIAGCNDSKGEDDLQDDWKNRCQWEDIDLIYIATPWNLHQHYYS